MCVCAQNADGSLITGEQLVMLYVGPKDQGRDVAEKVSEICDCVHAQVWLRACPIATTCMHTVTDMEHGVSRGPLCHTLISVVDPWRSF